MRTKSLGEGCPKKKIKNLLMRGFIEGIWWNSLEDEFQMVPQSSHNVMHELISISRMLEDHDIEFEPYYA